MSHHTATFTPVFKPERLWRMNQTAWSVYLASQGRYGWPEGEWWTPAVHEAKSFPSRRMTAEEVEAAQAVGAKLPAKEDLR